MQTPNKWQRRHDWAELYMCRQRERHTCPAKIPHTPIMQRMLKTAEPTMVPTPTSPWVINTPANAYVIFIQAFFCIIFCCLWISTVYTGLIYYSITAGSTITVAVCVRSPITDAKSSGAELPAAMKVAPATSSLRSSFCRTHPISRTQTHRLQHTRTRQRQSTNYTQSTVHAPQSTHTQALTPSLLVSL